MSISNLFHAIEDYATKYGIEEIDRLIAAGVDIYTKDNMGHTPLHYAAIWGNTEAINALLMAGANVNTKHYENKERTPLHYAINYGARSVRYVKAVKALLDAGADVSAKDTDGLTPNDHASYCDFEDIKEILREATAKQQSKI